METKVCTECGIEKPVEDFHWHYKDKGIRRLACKICRSEKEKKRQQNPEFVKKRAEYQLKKNYGIDQEEYDTKLERQKYRCAICGSKANKRKLAVDHCHATGAIRDLLCSLCNVGLGAFRDVPELLEKAAEYLRKHGRT